MSQGAGAAGGRAAALDRVLDRHDAKAAAGTSGQRVRQGARWLGAGNAASQATRVASTVVLARLLTPRVYGLVALVNVVTGFFERVLGDTGTTVALVRNPEITQRLASSVFWFNLTMGALTTATFVVAGGPIASFLGEPGAAGLVRALGCMALLNASCYVPRALLRRQARFRNLAVSNYVNVIVTAGASIGLAVAGWDEWALVVGSLTGSAAWVVSIWLMSPWRPSFAFSRGSLKQISGFSFNFSLNNLFGYFTDSGDRFVVGRFLGSTDLGFYGLANRLLKYPLQTSTQTYREVMLPTLARLQDDHAELRRVYLRSVSGIAFALLPATVAVSVLAEPLVLTFLGAKWRDAIPLVSIIALVAALQAITTTTGALYSVAGRSDLLLRWGVASALVTMVFYSVGTIWDVEGVAAAYLAAIVVLTYPSFRLSFGLVGLSFRRLVLTLTPTILATAVAAAVMFAARLGAEEAGAGPGLQLLTGAAAGGLTYGAYALVFRPKAFKDLLTLVRGGGRKGRRPEVQPAS